MKHRLYILTISIIASLNCLSQNDFDPKVLILSPYDVNVKKKTKKSLDLYQEHCIQSILDYYKNHSDSLIQLLVQNDSIQKNFKEHFMNQIQLAHSLNYSSIISFDKANSAQQYLSLELPNVLVKYSALKSNGDLQSLKQIADSLNVNYIINIPIVEFSHIKKTIVAKPRFQLYDPISNEILIDNVCELSEFGNPFSNCEYEDGEIEILHAGVKEFSIILNTIKSNKSTAHRLLEKNRTEYLDSLYLDRSDYSSIETILKETLIHVDLNGYYFGIYNQDQSKFIAFYAIETESSEFADASGYDLTIYYGRNDRGSWLIEDETHNTLIDYQGKLAENKRRFFINLFRHNYFMENNTDLSPEFWDKKLFNNRRPN